MLDCENVAAWKRASDSSYPRRLLCGPVFIFGSKSVLALLLKPENAC